MKYLKPEMAIVNIDDVDVITGSFGMQNAGTGGVAGGDGDMNIGDMTEQP